MMNIRSLINAYVAAQAVIMDIPAHDVTDIRTRLELRICCSKLLKEIQREIEEKNND